MHLVFVRFVRLSLPEPDQRLFHWHWWRGVVSELSLTLLNMNLGSFSFLYGKNNHTLLLLLAFGSALVLCDLMQLNLRCFELLHFLVLVRSVYRHCW